MIGMMGMGMGDMGSLMGMASWVGQMSPQNLYGNLNPQQMQEAFFQDPGQALLPQVDFDGLRSSMLRLQGLQQARDQRDQRVAERLEADLQDAKADFFLANHYEWPDGPEGRPVIVEGAETAEQSRDRQRWERQQVEAVQDRQSAQGNTPDPGSARARLQQLQSNPDELQAMLGQPNGQQEYQQLVSQATLEEETQTVQNKAEELLASTPEPLRGDVLAMRDQVLTMRRNSQAELDATPEAQAVAQYQSMIQQWAANQRNTIMAQGGFNGFDGSITFG